MKGKDGEWLKRRAAIEQVRKEHAQIKELKIGGEEGVQPIDDPEINAQIPPIPEASTESAPKLPRDVALEIFERDQMCGELRNLTTSEIVKRLREFERANPESETGEVPND